MGDVDAGDAPSRVWRLSRRLVCPPPGHRHPLPACGSSLSPAGEARVRAEDLEGM